MKNTMNKPEKSNTKIQTSKKTNYHSRFKPRKTQPEDWNEEIIEPRKIELKLKQM